MLYNRSFFGNFQYSLMLIFIFKVAGRKQFNTRDFSYSLKLGLKLKECSSFLSPGRGTLVST